MVYLLAKKISVSFFSLTFDNLLYLTEKILCLANQINAAETCDFSATVLFNCSITR